MSRGGSGLGRQEHAIDSGRGERVGHSNDMTMDRALDGSKEI